MSWGELLWAFGIFGFFVFVLVYLATKDQWSWDWNISPKARSFLKALVTLPVLLMLVLVWLEVAQPQLTLPVWQYLAATLLVLSPLMLLIIGLHSPYKLTEKKNVLRLHLTHRSRFCLSLGFFSLAGLVGAYWKFHSEEPLTVSFNSVAGLAWMACVGYFGFARLLETSATFDNNRRHFSKGFRELPYDEISGLEIGVRKFGGPSDYSYSHRLFLNRRGKGRIRLMKVYSTDESSSCILEFDRRITSFINK